jgi:hypothetical protein
MTVETTYVEAKKIDKPRGKGVLPCVSNRYICGVDYGDGKSQGAFTVFKDGKLKWYTQKLWKAKLYMWWMKVKGVTIIRETA